MRPFLRQAEQFSWRMAAHFMWDDRAEYIHPTDLHMHPDELTQYFQDGNFDESGPVHMPTVNRLAEEIAKNGIRQPISLVTDGTHAYMDSGHHRTVAAQQLGMDEVPVRVTRSDYPLNTPKMPTPEVGPSGLLRRYLDSQQRQANSRLAAVTQEMVDGLNTHFHDWWEQQGNAAGSADDMARMDFMDEERGPIGYWPNIENFLKDEYPAAHKGLGMGLEAEWSLDGHAKPYLTGPEAIAEHGYDPSEIAAGMLLLHNQSDPFRGDMAQQDQDRLNDIAQKRFMMQRNYDNRTAPKELVMAYRTAMAWDEWSDKVQHIPNNKKDGGLYYVEHEPYVISELEYSYHPDNSVKVNWINTQPKYQKDGVAEAMMRRLHHDNPDHRINPGLMTADGRSFYRQLLKKKPSAKDIVHIDRLIDIAEMQRNYEQKQQVPQPITAALELLRITATAPTLPQTGIIEPPTHFSPMADGNPK